MTSTNSSRRATTRRPVGFHGGRGGSGGSGNGRSPVGEQLREARETKGLDLHRVERDTKIRTKYLEALESGDFGDLPGEVYARGFLRNYATYLGLDADEVVDEWRGESGRPAPVVPAKPGFVGPQPMRIRRGVVFQRSHIVIAIVAIIVIAVGSYFGYQVTRFLQYPSVAVSDPSGQKTLQLPAGTTSYVLKGTATPGTTVLISWDGQNPVEVEVDDSGHWAYTALLHLDTNQFDITAKNLDTNHASQSSRVIILVPVVTPSPPHPEVAFATPADGASVKDGAVNVTGTSTLVGTVTLTPTYLGPPPAPGATIPPTPTQEPGVSSAPSAGSTGSPGASAGPSASPGPTPATANPGADGTFAFTLTLGPGRWQLTLTGSSANGQTAVPVSRTIAVPYKGLYVVLEVKGGPAWMRYAGDGAGIGQSTYPDGYTATLTLTKWFCVYVSGQPGRVFVTVNGTSLGTVSKYGGTHLYVDTTSAAKNVAGCPA
jgi:cytoskeletal protein RodZ